MKGETHCYYCKLYVGTKRKTDITTSTGRPMGLRSLSVCFFWTHNCTLFVHRLEVSVAPSWIFANVTQKQNFFFPLFFLGGLQPGGAAWWLQTRETAASSPTPPPSTCPLQKGEVAPLSAQTGRRSRRRRKTRWELSWVSHKKQTGVSVTVTSEKVGGAGVGVGGERVGQQACRRNRVTVP